MYNNDLPECMQKRRQFLCDFGKNDDFPIQVDSDYPLIQHFFHVIWARKYMEPIASNYSSVAMYCENIIFLCEDIFTKKLFVIYSDSSLVHYTIKYEDFHTKINLFEYWESTDCMPFKNSIIPINYYNYTYSYCLSSVEINQLYSYMDNCMYETNKPKFDIFNIYERAKYNLKILQIDLIRKPGPCFSFMFDIIYKYINLPIN
jgi:hypothetical protein